MSQSLQTNGDEAVLPAEALESLVTLLGQEGFQPVGPMVQDGHLKLDCLSTVGDLPQGWTTDADAGIFRLSRRSDQAYFGFNLGQESWKKFLFPAQLPLVRSQRLDNRLTFEAIADTAPPYALIGVRACELAALDVHDRTLPRRALPGSGLHRPPAGRFYRGGELHRVGCRLFLRLPGHRARR